MVKKEITQYSSAKPKKDYEIKFLMMYATSLQILKHVNSLQFKQYLEAEEMISASGQTELKKLLREQLDPSLVSDDEEEIPLVKNLSMLKNKIFNFKFSNKG